MNGDAFATGGGMAAAALALSYVGKLVLEWWQTKNAADMADATTPVTNASTANEVLLGTLTAVDRERKAVRDRLDSVEALLERTRQELNKERMIREQQSKRVDEHDREIGLMRRQFALAVGYIRALLAFITDQGLTDSAPEPPSGLNID